MASIFQIGDIVRILGSDTGHHEEQGVVMSVLDSSKDTHFCRDDAYCMIGIKLIDGTMLGVWGDQLEHI